MDNLENGAIDSHDFIKWQTEMKNLDQEKLLLEIEKRKLKGKISYEEAILSKERLVDRNKKIANSIKKEKQSYKQVAIQEKTLDEKKVKENIEKINQSRKNCKVKQAYIQIQKQKIAKEIVEKSEELVDQAVKEVTF